MADILLAFAEGLNEKEILRNFRTVRKEDITAALVYAYCITDGININIKTAGGKKVLMENEVAAQEEMQRMANQSFSSALEEQAAQQEELTKAKLETIKAKKEEERGPKLQTPEKRDYDLEIFLDDDAQVKIFNSKDESEQGLDMTVDNYVFELREDDDMWLVYSIKDGNELDRDMKRNIKLHYNGKEAIFEGYLSNDRLNKIFIAKDEEGVTQGRAL